MWDRDVDSEKECLLLLSNFYGFLNLLYGTLGFPDSSAGKESACNAGGLGSVPGLGRSPGEGKSYPLQYSGLEKSMGSQRVGCNWVTFTSLHFTSWYLRASLIAHLVKNPPAMQETLVRFLGREDPLGSDRLPTPVSLDFPCGSAGKESACNVGDLGSILGLEISPGEGKGYPLQYSCLENPMDRGARQATVHGVAKSWTWLSDFNFFLSMVP